MDIQWGGFLIGLVIGGVGAFAAGFLKKAGEDAWRSVKEKVFPSEPEPISVAAAFNPQEYEQGHFAWVPDVDRHDKEVEGYSYFRHPNNNAKCYRQLPHRKEFLMRRPD
jgi:hypothetical protein